MDLRGIERSKMPPKSKKQAGFLGAIAGGKSKKKGGPSKEQAKEMLRGSKVKGLPTRAKKKSKGKRGKR